MLLDYKKKALAWGHTDYYSKIFLLWHLIPNIEVDRDIHCESEKQDIKLLPITSPNINRFPNSFNDRLGDNFATNSYLHIPPHFRYVATLPWEIWTSEKWRKSKLCIAINDKSQGSIAKHLSWGGLLHYKFIIQYLKEFVTSASIWRSYRQNGWSCHTPHSLYSFVIKDAELAR